MDGYVSAHRTRHVSQRTAWKPSEEGYFAVESNFIVTYTGHDVRGTEVFATGIYQDLVRFEIWQLKFMKKQVVVDCPILNRYLVFPL